jgi:hypothetical protein
MERAAPQASCPERGRYEEPATLSSVGDETRW